ncbi:hypothetical protein [Dokdonella sp.]|uniref:hypothetical protein n=1 Tax=Dokdonella sp. TaxID=2291710 RepID=UPI002F3EA351
MRTTVSLGLALAFAGNAGAAEVTIKNDSLTDFGSAAIVWGFVTGEMAGSWLTSPCDGNLVAVQIFWRSPSGVSADVIGNAIHIYRSGTFPAPGDEAQTIGGPVLQDNALNEWRYLDDNNTLPLIVPVTMSETVVVAFEFPAPPEAGVDPSVVRDTDGNTSGRNTIYADVGGSFAWFDSATLGVNGDWVIRAVVNCTTMSTDADVSVSMTATPTAYTAGDALQYTIVVANAGPASSPNTTLVDTFPAAFQAPTWTCASSGGATCPAGSSGNIIGSSSLPAGGQITFTVDGSVAPGTTGTLSNSMTAVVNAPATDPSGTNNTASLDLEVAASDVIFANGFDGAAIILRPVAARATGRPPR